MQALFTMKRKKNNLNKKKQRNYGNYNLTSPEICGRIVMDPSCFVMVFIGGKR